MRKLVLVAVLIAHSYLLNAQTDKRATAILDAMSSKYKSMTSFRVNFTYTNEGAGAKETYKGEALVKGTKFKLKMAGQEIFNDGKIMTTYVKESNEATITNYDPKESSDIDPTKIYTIYKKGYKYLFIEETTENGRTYEVVELSPEKKESKVAKVQIKVDKKDKSVKSWKVTQKNGQRVVFKVDKFAPNAAPDDKLFAFDSKLYKGVEMIDLR
jgi:outer membrane lipoprotein-sorting protein